MIGLGTLAGALAFVAHTRAIRGIEQTMHRKGITWESKNHSWRTLQWEGLATPFGTIASLHLDLLDQTLRTGLITVTALDRPTSESPKASASPTAGDPSPPAWIPLKLDDLHLEPSDIFIDVGGVFPMEESITISNQPGSAWSLARAEDGAWGLRGTELTATLGEHSMENIAIEVTASTPPVMTVRVPSFRVAHPLLSQDPIPAHPMQVETRLEDGGERIALSASYGTVSGRATLRRTGDSVAMEAFIPMTPLADIAALFGDAVPETSAMTINGTIGLKGGIAGPPWTWTAEPTVTDLSAAGGLPSSLGSDQVQFESGSTVHVVGPSIEGWVPLASAGWFPEAVIAAEDIRFATHPGFDLVAIQEAIDAAPNEDRIRGGSTITQQLAKNLFLDGRRTLRRKLRELLLALSLEDRMTKDGILQLYINVVEFGPNIRGIHDASRAWFLKNPGQLTPREAAFLAAILPAPNAWHARIKRTGKPPVTVVNRVLDNMRRKRIISEEEHRRERNRRLRLVPP